ncbi:MAG TPA: SMI1/KNR4 family protein [Vicinamibacteria bacterium]|nr:SMI1/KNR4 family protein [Vicinamibacteria bacterium]
MKLWGFWREPKQLLPAEERLLDLLLADGGPDLAMLRRQWAPPFFFEVERRRRPDYYELGMAYDAAQEDLVPGTASVGIDDLRVEVAGVRGACRVVGHVSEGILGTVWVCAPDGRAVSWPRWLDVRSWSYVAGDGSTGPTRTRPYSLAGPSVAEMVAELEARSGRPLPAAYRDYLLAHPRDHERRGVRMLRASQVYRLDEPPAVGPTLAIGSFADGFALGLRIEDGAIVEFDRADLRPHEVAPSFAAWLKPPPRRRSKG